MKPLLPSLKEKKRYLVFEVLEGDFNYNDVKEVVSNSCFKFLGELGMAKAGIKFLDEFQDNKGIVKVNNKYLNELKASLALVKEINNKKTIIKTIGVSGILKKAKERYLAS